ncbi:putative benzoate 4-monooxygenase cytochrome P450 [Botryosphaeria dothidea]|uniref:Benzoate 4-monooxygenase cytochrome P450 n=1 Tax=Botryosphaeria dothidea TaxID=55169 RepID=A0A8H4IJH6_9PEZI|nr:putative benzoate 4-monooxygenase cytochrome P450 [Botryosphaeria dothidea]
MDSTTDTSFAGLKIVLETNHVTAATSTAVLGILFHITVVRYLDVDNFMYTFLALLWAASALVTSAHLLIGFSFISACARVLLLAISFDAGLFLSMAVYRVFFHRLRKFPGPFGAKVSRFYSAYLAGKDVKYYKEVEKMHRKYGDFIRTEITTTTNGGARRGTEDSQSKVWANLSCERETMNMLTWNPALNTYEPRIKRRVDGFVSQVSNIKTLDATAWSMYLSFDIMGEVGFGKDFGGIASGTEHPAIKGIHSHMEILGIMSHVPWFLNLISRVPGAAASYAGFFSWCAAEIKAKQKQWDPEQYPQDIVSWLLKAYVEKDTSASPTEEALHEDSRVVIIAGSETTATTLTSILYFLAKHPAVYRKLQSHVDAAIPTPIDWTYEKVKSITYIDDIINETLRLKPALMTGGYRVTPPQGLQIDEQYIPGDTNVFVPVQLIQTDDRYWKRAAEFVPERFGEKRIEMETDGAPFIPFALGAYQCPGKNLAMISMRIVLSRIAQQFDVSFAPGETGEVFDKEALDTFTTALPPVMMEFSERKK